MTVRPVEVGGHALARHGMGWGGAGWGGARGQTEEIELVDAAVLLPEQQPGAGGDEAVHCCDIAEDGWEGTKGETRRDDSGCALWYLRTPGGCGMDDWSAFSISSFSLAAAAAPTG